MSDVEFQYADAGHALALHSAAPGLHRYDRHAHDEYSIILVTYGTKILRAGPRTLMASPGQIVVLPPGTSHDCEPLGATAWGHRCLYVSPDLMARIMGDARFAAAPPALRPVVDEPQLAGAILAWHARRTARPLETIDDEGADLLARAVAIAACGDAVAIAPPAPSAARTQTYLRVFRRDLSRKLDLDGLADRAGVSKFQVIRDVRSALHTTPGRLLRDLRLREAKRLIRCDVPIAEVPMMTGFSDQSHLTRAFKDAYAITPGTYRRAVS